MCIFTGALFLSIKKEKHSKCPPPSEGMNTVKPVSLRASSPSSRGVESRDRPRSGQPQTFMRSNRKAHILYACRYMEKSRKGRTKRRPVVSGPGVRTAQGFSLCRVMEVFSSWTGLPDSANSLTVTVNLEVVRCSAIGHKHIHLRGCGNLLRSASHRELVRHVCGARR